MGLYLQNNLNMKVTFLVPALALAVNAKTRRGPLPQIIREKFGHELKTNEPRIVGGDIISISERPFQVGLEYSFFDFTFCGGSLIGSNKVLTAAHCCDGESADDLKVRIGTDRNAEGGTTHMVSKVSMHPSYDSSTVANDACVLTLSESFTDSNAGTVSLPFGPINPSAGDMFEVSGWGTTSEGGDTSDQLRMVSVPYVDDASCDNSYGNIGGIVSDVMICAGEAGKDSCQGDSGGPMTFNGQHVGIVSWGIGCARAGYPGVYGQTDAMLDFINSA